MIASIVVIAAAVCSAGEPPARPERAPAEDPKGKEEAAPRSLEEALELVRRRYLSLLVIHRGEAPAAKEAGPRNGPAPKAPAKRASAFARDLAAFLDDRASEKTLAVFVRVELDGKALEAPYPEAKDEGEGGKPPATRRAGERLGIEPGVAALVVLDYREKVVRRYGGKLPSRAALRRELERISAAIARLAAETRRVEKILEAARYSYALGEVREAVLAVVPLDDPKVQAGVDAVLSARLAEVIARWKGDGAAAIAIGRALEADRRYLDAVKVYDAAARKYPFPEIIRDAGRRSADAARRAQGVW